MTNEHTEDDPLTYTKLLDKLIKVQKERQRHQRLEAEGRKFRKNGPLGIQPRSRTKAFKARGKKIASLQAKINKLESTRDSPTTPTKKTGDCYAWLKYGNCSKLEEGNCPWVHDDKKKGSKPPKSKAGDQVGTKRKKCDVCGSTGHLKRDCKAGSTGKTNKRRKTRANSKAKLAIEEEAHPGSPPPFPGSPKHFSLVATDPSFRRGGR